MTKMYILRYKDQPDVYHRAMAGANPQRRTLLKTCQLSEAALIADLAEAQEMVNNYPELEVCVVTLSDPQPLNITDHPAYAGLRKVLEETPAANLGGVKSMQLQ